MELTPEARAEIAEAVRIVNTDRTHRLNRDQLKTIMREELDAWKPAPPEPPTPPVPPTPPPGPTPPPPVPPTPPEPPNPPKKKRMSYWPEADPE